MIEKQKIGEVGDAFRPRSARTISHSVTSRESHPNQGTKLEIQRMQCIAMLNDAELCAASGHLRTMQNEIWGSNLKLLRSSLRQRDRINTPE